MTRESATNAKPLALAKRKDKSRHIHHLRNGFRCDTDRRGYATPDNKSPEKLVVDASEGFIPLWDKNVILRWRFAEGTLDHFQDPAAAERAIETLFGKAVLAWGDAVPIKFAKRTDAWDFQIVVRQADDCDDSGCVLASAFFPDAGRHRLDIYPKMFEQSDQEQLETLAHELGHVFGLRHFFALLSEKSFPAEIFGVHRRFSIMNYGEDSFLTQEDKSDLAKLYAAAWSRQLTDINGTPIHLVRPFHEGAAPSGALAVAAVRA
ncbi:matrix metalloproteinase-11 [Caulobacter segnis]|uniref:Peptidase M10A and M12B matrixin and adamalysin n=2 Tax=Caulobacter segnis TaxID=88688 RepID=D5VML5_CAUST|nr:matrixin family metalloprotease [Caulobacter segnis]ADG11738.1 peptidase M10A and M12B matrixin and adamalysin [Caulobacter segnis ATCC 21756]AVQ03379.1 matrix metalloproteinase-11 [Caulobacter segnis]